MAEISGAGTPVDIKLGQVPTIKDPALNYELQGIYNSLHILSQYLEVLRAGLEGSDTQTPAENIRFLKFIHGIAAQPITAGHVVSFDDVTGRVVKGTNYGAYRFDHVTNEHGVTSRYVTGLVQTFFGIATTDAAIGEDVTIGVGPAILKVTGILSGQQIWARTNKGIIFQGRGEDNPLVYGFDNVVLPEDGNLYIGFPGYKNIPGYPKSVGSVSVASCFAMASPVGVAVANDYVLLSDFQYWLGHKATSVFDMYPVGS